MNISLFDSRELERPFDDIISPLQSYIFISDTLYTFGNTDWINFFNVDFDTISDEMIIDYTKLLFKKDESVIRSVIKIEEMMNLMPKVKNIKHKEKRILTAMGKYKRVINFFRKELKYAYAKFVDTANLQELQKFIADDIWQIPFSYIIADAKKEDVFIQPIFQKMLQRDNLFGLDEKLEEFFTPTMLDESEPTDCDFIKIPYGEIPLAIGLSYNQIKYTRNDLQPVLLLFKTNLKELSDELIGIKFLPENMAKIKQLCNEKLNQHIAPVQQSLKDSLYLSHLRNQSAENTNSKLFFGIASAETIMDYYQKAKLVQPYVISEIKQRLQRHFDLKSSCIFAYLKQHPSNRAKLPETNSA